MDLSPLGRVEEKSHGNWSQASDLGDWGCSPHRNATGRKGAVFGACKVSCVNLSPISLHKAQNSAQDWGFPCQWAKATAGTASYVPPPPEAPVSGAAGVVCM